jgi:hypothetical protein
MQNILLYGTSIFLAGLAAQLQHLPNMQVVCRANLTHLGDLSAFNAVVIDLNDLHAADLLTLLRARPDLRVIGINEATGVLTTFAGQVYLARTIEDIAVQLTHPNPFMEP